MSMGLTDILKELRTLDLSGLYERDFAAPEAKSDGELAGVLAVADALRDLRGRNYATVIFRTGLALWEGPEERGWAPFAAACAMVGLRPARVETLTAETLAACAPDVICPRSDAGGTADALYRAGALDQRPLSLPRDTALPLVLRLIHQKEGVEALRETEAPLLPQVPADLPDLVRRFGMLPGIQPLEREELWAVEALWPYVLAAMILLGKCPDPVRALETMQRQAAGRRLV